MLKIRAREEAVFGLREAREQEKLRQMLAKKGKGPLTDPELEKRRQDALKLKEKDEEKRRAEAAMSTAMAALGKSSLARFTANYGKGVRFYVWRVFKRAVCFGVHLMRSSGMVLWMIVEGARSSAWCVGKSF